MKSFYCFRVYIPNRIYLNDKPSPCDSQYRFGFYFPKVCPCCLEKNVQSFKKVFPRKAFEIGFFNKEVRKDDVVSVDIHACSKDHLKKGLILIRKDNILTVITGNRDYAQMLKKENDVDFETVSQFKRNLLVCISNIRRALILLVKVIVYATVIGVVAYGIIHDLLGLI